jgi:hypothetical protein
MPARAATTAGRYQLARCAEDAGRARAADQLHPAQVHDSDPAFRGIADPQQEGKFGDCPADLPPDPDRHVVDLVGQPVGEGGAQVLQHVLVLVGARAEQPADALAEAGGGIGVARLDQPPDPLEKGSLHVPDRVAQCWKATLGVWRRCRPVIASRPWRPERAAAEGRSAPRHLHFP